MIASIDCQYAMNMLTLFFMTEMPAPPQNVRVSPERVSGTNTILWVKWMRPQNFDKFDIDRYYITVTWRSGMAPDIQGTTVTAPGESTHTLITVKENETEQYNATVVARSFCERSCKCSHLFCIDLKL